jgi:type I pantothenate kinase
VVQRPDILVFEGLNVLQSVQATPVVMSDFFDFSIYLDAAEVDVEAWYVQRFLALQKTAFQQPTSYFHHYRDLEEGEAREVARGIWRDINLVNLRDNIRPTRQRADLVLRKRADHTVGEVWLRHT